jgi:hypothetical protein
MRLRYGTAGDRSYEIMSHANWSEASIPTQVQTRIAKGGPSQDLQHWRFQRHLSDDEHQGFWLPLREHFSRAAFQQDLRLKCLMRDGDSLSARERAGAVSPQLIWIRRDRSLQKDVYSPALLVPFIWSMPSISGNRPGVAAAIGRQIGRSVFRGCKSAITKSLYRPKQDLARCRLEPLAFAHHPGKNMFCCSGCGRGGHVTASPNSITSSAVPRGLRLLRQWRG